MLYLTIGSNHGTIDDLTQLFNEIGVLCLLADQSSEYILTPQFESNIKGGEKSITKKPFPNQRSLPEQIS
jgi:hypothetical protein